MGQPAVEIHGVTKRFRLYKEKPKTFKERFIRLGRNPYEEFYALRDVTIEVSEGETVGLLGHNGSGKSTLLKCVSGTLRPTQGAIRTYGRVAALLELGAGFHPDLTGRENVFLNGSILGFSKADMERKFDEIVDFSELEPFIDSQVKHYSSGMYARLGFAVAVNVDPDVLIIDEVLSVGDEAFQRKCMDRIKSFRREGRTMLFVTHAADLVRQICDRGAVLDHGELVMDGPPGEAVRAFRQTLLERGVEVPEEYLEDEAGQATGDVRAKTYRVRITSVQVEYPASTGSVLLPDEPMRVRIGYLATRPTSDAIFALEIHDQLGNLLLGVNTQVIDTPVGTIDGAGECVYEFERVPLQDGTYLVSVGIHNDTGVEYDQRVQLDSFEVMNPGRTIGLVHFPLDARVLVPRGAVGVQAAVRPETAS
ncbi:MAG: ABC transporter ATP-binding protein [Acidimicrobiales bacterium]|nr:ABC transporter ATP-binding protein [Acidimicrobiales bacterium]